ncbi:type VII secretion protein EccE [Tsukamurella sp. 1534]|uniref:type VII secretion protein EccE n=1 Tax=Tsukamurella sp. 1534 TaxID=1151061 RepID=UPI00031E84A2|nr:type VII secretion protein EccE [Tsukamurella sp. 1534]
MQQISQSGVPATSGLAAPGRWERGAWPSAGAVLLAETAAVAAGLGTAAAGGPHWAAAAAALAAGGAALTRRRGTSLAELAGDRLRRRTAQHVTVASAPYPGGGDIGVRRESGLLTAVLRITPPAPRLITPQRRDAPSVPLAALAGLLRHGDTPAARIDVLVNGGRAPSGAERPRGRYQNLTGPITAWAVADVRIAITIDPVDCAGALARRGGDELRVAAIAAQRLADVLAGEGVPSTPVTARDTGPGPSTPPDGAVPADPDRLADGDIDHLIAAAASVGTAAISLRRGAGDDVRVGAWLCAPDADPGRPLRGDHNAAGTVPSLRRFHQPLAGCGQLVGADATGGPVTVRLHGPGVRTVWAAVADDPARQLVERAVATGARVLLVTGRPAMWEPLVSWTGSPENLWISGWRYPPEPHLSVLSPADYTVTVLDGTAAGLQPGSVEPAGTVWRIETAGISPVTEADVVLSQPQPGMLTVRTDGGAATVRLVA